MCYLAPLHAFALETQSPGMYLAFKAGVSLLCNRIVCIDIALSVARKHEPMQGRVGCWKQGGFLIASGRPRAVQRLFRVEAHDTCDRLD